MYTELLDLGPLARMYSVLLDLDPLARMYTVLLDLDPLARMHSTPRQGDIDRQKTRTHKIF